MAILAMMRYAVSVARHKMSSLPKGVLHNRPCPSNLGEHTLEQKYTLTEAHPQLLRAKIKLK